MGTYLITWNPKSWPWRTLNEGLKQLRKHGILQSNWSTGTRKNMPLRSRIFLLKQGPEPRGIMGSGFTCSPIIRKAHWDPERRRAGDKGNFVEVELDQLLHPDEDLLLARSSLDHGVLAKGNWNTRASGIELHSAVARQLERLWGRHIRGKFETAPAQDEELGMFEGESRWAFIQHRKREVKLRREKIQEALRRNHGRLPCEVPGCGFDFSITYGAVGKLFAHVHHLQPLASVKERRRTRLSDLVVVCANCHAMIHRGGECRGINGLVKTSHFAGRMTRPK